MIQLKKMCFVACATILIYYLQKRNYYHYNYKGLV